MRYEDDAVGRVRGDGLLQFGGDRLRGTDEGLPGRGLDGRLPDGQPLGTPPARAFQAAVNGLRADGTYDRILKKWGTTGPAVKTSEISPPEIR